MVDSRTRRSLAQYLGLQDGELIALLLDTHGLDGGGVSEAVRCGTGFLSPLVASLDAGGETQILALLDEIARTSRGLRSNVSPRYRYDERFEDLRCCLKLVGYLIKDDRLIPIDPSIGG